ncbi:biotin-dependent carboxyltransferase family protein [Virgibacillus halodenitrificans]|uniref:5-oxoprolinase subunit C family protein n=1 Tax=Virgibacillus halodenitrificans TaxID=1482 RepID=UPI00045D496E|nr:biotin-dependent carboxyltransferase family protein [Virgibacillus halodenitrificans]MCG1026812.1 biotin-dependent carboxyltransferase family protein [Virgibacillus halodenitrificans]CDQ30868.1 KipI antagonist [Virgibacillus halodenitrificans]
MDSSPIFQVIKPGIYTTFQDMGRIGFQKYGLPVAGAMDLYAFQIGNILVGNTRNTVSLEVTLIGPKLKAKAAITVAITGANLEPEVNGQSRPMWSTFQLEKGDVLSFGKYHSGVRAYISVAGGFDVPVLFQSQSTDIRSGIGQTLDHYGTLKGLPKSEKEGIGLSKPLIPTYATSIEVGVIEGPHMSSFTSDERKDFFNKTFRVEPNSNRMGYRLSNSKKVGTIKQDIWSDAVPFGGIQVPPNGQPIILMADRQPTGGYPRIGTVISTDLPKIAQLPPQSEVSFYPISVEEAQERVIRLERELVTLGMIRKHMPSR